MSVTRYDVWIGKTSKRKVTGAPKLKSLPPTPEAFEQNVRRAHFQVSVWKAALEKGSPELAPTNFGWEKDEASSSLLPVMGHIGSIPCEARYTIGTKKYVPKKINSEVMAVFVLFIFAAAILAAILNISISPRVPEWHQPDSV